MPQLPSASVQRPLSSVTMASIISPDQASPVMHWKSRRNALPMSWKFLLAVYISPSAVRNVKSVIPCQEGGEHEVCDGASESSARDGT